MKQKTEKDRFFDGEEYWESPSLAWIHQVRRKMMEEFDKKGRKPISNKDFEAMAKKYNLKILTSPKVITK
jgi:hypothetical protein